MDEENEDMEKAKKSETFCDMYRKRSPECADCEAAKQEFFEEKIGKIGKGLGIDIPAMIFRIFHPAKNTRGYWRTRLCRHFIEMLDSENEPEEDKE